MGKMEGKKSTKGEHFAAFFCSSPAIQNHQNLKSGNKPTSHRFTSLPSNSSQTILCYIQRFLSSPLIHRNPLTSPFQPVQTPSLSPPPRCLPGQAVMPLNHSPSKAQT